MPIRGIANSSNTIPMEHMKVEVHGRGSYEAKVYEEAEFSIDASKTAGHGAGMPVVRLTGVQSDVEVRIRQTEANIFLCSYIATAPGLKSKVSFGTKTICLRIFSRCLFTEYHLG